jgi:hypothetical protein
MSALEIIKFETERRILVVSRRTGFVAAMHRHWTTWQGGLETVSFAPADGGKPTMVMLRRRRILLYPTAPTR